MSAFFERLFASDFMPHGASYGWSPEVVWLHVISDGLIGLAYYSIPITLFYFVRKRRDIPFTGVLLMFAGSIVACGTTHLMEVWNVWNGAYRISGVVKAGTAALSVSTAFMLIKVLPRAMALESPDKLARINQDLGREIVDRKAAEEKLRKNEEFTRSWLNLTDLMESRTAELRDSENRLRGLFDQAAVGLAMVGLDGAWLRVNHRLCEIVGYSEEDLLQLNFQRITHPEDLEADAAQVRRLLAGEIDTYAMEKRYICKDSSTVWIQLTASLVREKGMNDRPGAPRYFIAVVEDISARHKAQEELEKTLKEILSLKFALDEHAIVAITDPQGRITYANQKFCAISQYSREELIGQNHRIINSHQHPREFFRELWATISQGRVWKGEICNRARDGSHYWVETTIVPYLGEDGRPYQYVAIRADVTQRKVAEESIYRLAAIVDSSEDAIVSKRLDGTVISWNAGAERLFGYAATEILGRSIDLIIPDSLRSEEEQILIRIAQGESVKNLETTRKCKDGRLVEVSSSIAPLKNASGKIIGASKISRDITDKKKAEAHTRDSLREKETLLKEIHHRVKNNMQLVSSLLQLQSRTISDPGARSVFRDGQNRIRSMALIHEKLYRSTSLARIDFPEYIRSLVGILTRTYDTRSHGVVIESKVDSISLNLDTAVPVGLILNELISNCLKHAFPEGRHGKVEVSIQRSGEDHLTLTVRDDGVGMPAHFDPGNSKTLGMRLVHILTEQIQGTLQITNHGGTEFQVIFNELNVRDQPQSYAT